MVATNNICNHCRRGNAEFQQWVYTHRKVEQIYACTYCGAIYKREVKPGDIDLLHPTVKWSAAPTPEYRKLVGDT